MFGRSALLLAALLLAAVTAAADSIPGGSVSGTWSAANSPYYILGDITVGSGNTLNIEPGVDVYFCGPYQFTIEGWLDALGSETDSIHFIAEDTTSRWYGLRFQSAPDSSHLAYCTVRYAQSRANMAGGIGIDASSPVITHSSISDNIGDYGGGLGLGGGAGPHISNSTIAKNDAVYDGGAICFHMLAGSATITDCVFEDNSAYRGGGLYMVTMSQAVISDCAFLGNTATYGGAIYGNPTGQIISRTTFGDNFAGEAGGGGGINCTNDLTLFRCVFFGNTGEQGSAIHVTNGAHLDVDQSTFSHNMYIFTGGTAIHIDNGSATVRNTIVSYNQGIALRGSPFSIEYCDLFGNGSNCSNPPSGFGTLDTINYNGDSCDQYFNIFTEPMFVDTTAHDYHLQAASPCIDAGDPLSPFDPDSTITDIGAYWFQAKDAGVTGIDAPQDTVFTDSTYSVVATLHNFGYATSTFDVVATINGYADTVQVQDLDPDSSVQVAFTNWQVPPADSTSYVMIVCTYLADDRDTTNDCAQKTIFAYDPTGIEESRTGPNARASAFELRQSEPNPFSGRTTITYSLPNAGHVTLDVFDLSGRLVKTLVNETKYPGIHRASWSTNGKAAGVYFYRLRAGDIESTRKMVVID